MIDEIDVVRVNGKVYLSKDKILEILDQEMDEVNYIEPKYWLRLYRIRVRIAMECDSYNTEVNDSIKMVTNAEEAKEYPISENISKDYSEIFED